ncbi:MAG: hypothetical protein ACXWZL_09340 [Mycobacterium sp.]
MTRGKGIYDDEEGSTASENAKADEADGDERGTATPDVDESAGEATA